MEAQPRMDGKAGVQGTLSSLPLDLLIQILFFVDPTDILSLRLCCRSLRVASETRTVWANTLKKLCHLYGLYAYMFPVDTMSLKDMEYAATANVRLSARLWNEFEQAGPVSAIITKLLTLDPANYPDMETGEFVQAFLIPGGRFLITTTTTNLVQLWDLGYSPSSLIHGKALASIVIPHLDHTWAFIARANEDGVNIHFPLLTSAPTVSEHALDIYEINPISASPTFQLISGIRYHPPGDQDELELVHFDVADPYVVMVFENGHIMLWNFREDLWCNWHIPFSTPHWSEVHIHQADIFVHLPGEVAIYTIPSLSPRLPGEVAAPSSYPSQHPLRVLVEQNQVGMVYTLYDNQFGSAMDMPAHFETVCRNGTISRYVMQHVQATCLPGLPSLPNLLPTHVVSFEAEKIELNPSLSSGNLTRDDRLMTWFNGNDVFAFIDRSDRSSFNGKLGHLIHCESRPKFVHMCRLSGRMILSTSGQEIRVLDFVRPPSQCSP